MPLLRTFILSAPGSASFSRVSTLAGAFRRLSYDGPPAGANEEAIDGHALAFLDELVSRAKERRLERPVNQLEAQSIVWVMQRWPELPDAPNGVDPEMAPLARELHLPVDFLQNIETLL